MTDDEPGAELSTYELRVLGQLGPLLLSALPHAVDARVPGHTVLITEASDELDLVEVVRLLVATGLEVDSIRETKHEDWYASRLPVSIRDQPYGTCPTNSLVATGD
jgi:hypothetical protein